MAVKLYSLDFYLKCMLGGALACGISHALMVPLDIHKCRSQAHYRSGLWPKSIGTGLGRIAAKEGFAGLRIGWVPTAFGYSMQGAAKYGGNEWFKKTYGDWVGGEQNLSKPAKIALWAAASASAEVCGDVFLTPFEMVKVKMQVELPGSNAGISQRIVPAIAQMWAARAATHFPFGSFMPVVGRQVPYTVIKFVVFYQSSEWVYNQLAARGVLKEKMSTASKLGVTAACGYFAGVFCAIASQPMDNLVSLKGNPENAKKGWGQLASEMGILNLFTRGLFTRILMIGTMSSMQWYTFGQTKAVFGFGTQ